MFKLEKKDYYLNKLYNKLMKKQIATLKHFDEKKI